MGRSNIADRPTPHSIQAIRSSRAGGKKAPKKYRKHHQNKNKKNKEMKTSGNIFSRAVHYIIKTVGRL
jgi:hypothetical protein